MPRRTTIYIVQRDDHAALVGYQKFQTEPGQELGNAGVEIAHAIREYLETQGTAYVGDSITVETRKPR